MVTRTGGRLPAASASTISSGTRMPTAVLPLRRHGRQPRPAQYNCASKHQDDQGGDDSPCCEPEAMPMNAAPNIEYVFSLLQGNVAALSNSLPECHLWRQPPR